MSCPQQNLAWLSFRVCLLDFDCASSKSDARLSFPVLGNLADGKLLLSVHLLYYLVASSLNFDLVAGSSQSVLAPAQHGCCRCTFATTIVKVHIKRGSMSIILFQVI